MTMYEFHIAYQTKWVHHNNWDEMPNVVPITAATPADAIAKFHHIIKACFGEELKASITAIAPPAAAPHEIKVLCYYANEDNLTALEKACCKKKWLIDGVRFSVEPGARGEAIAVVAEDEEGAIMYAQPFWEGCYTLRLDIVEAETGTVAKSTEYQPRWHGQWDRDATEWYEVVGKHLQEHMKLFSTPGEKDDPEACPGCGNKPGEGRKAGCTDPIGCGHLGYLETATHILHPGIVWVRVPDNMAQPTVGPRCTCPYCTAHPAHKATYDSMGVQEGQRTWTVHFPELWHK
jgi:hypothetical protein